MGPGLAYADLSESKGKTAVSFILVLYGEAIARLDEAAEHWKKLLS
jgi:cyanate lyase